MVKRHGEITLHVEGRYAAFRAGEPHDGPPVYWLHRDDEIEVLDDVQWADWDSRGRLLVATTSGRLLAGKPGRLAEVADLSGLHPRSFSPPDWASRW